MAQRAVLLLSLSFALGAAGCEATCESACDDEYDECLANAPPGASKADCATEHNLCLQRCAAAVG